jgi:hypothetical protein
VSPDPDTNPPVRLVTPDPVTKRPVRFVTAEEPARVKLPVPFAPPDVTNAPVRFVTADGPKAPVLFETALDDEASGEDPWPALAARPVGDDEPWRAAFRDAERRRRLDLEQRGEPWNA